MFFGVSLFFLIKIGYIFYTVLLAIVRVLPDKILNETINSTHVKSPILSFIKRGKDYIRLFLNL